jgi:hypothetical protein
MKHDPKFSANTHPAGGWGSVQSLGRSLAREHVPLRGTRILMHQNKPDGFACVSCAWAKPAKPHPCEAAGLALVAIAREDSVEVFTHAQRIHGVSSWRSPRPTAMEEICFPTG